MESRKVRSPTSARAVLLLHYLTAIVLMIGAIRVIELTTHNPVLGYANNHDMFRIQSCLGIWPADERIDNRGSSPEAPLERYTFSDFDMPCIPSSELVLTYPMAVLLAALSSISPMESFSIRLFGASKAVALAAAAVFFSFYFARRRHHAAALANAFIFAFVIADPVNTLYGNTFYSEFSSLFFFYTSVGLLYCVGTSGGSRTLSIGFGISLCLLSTSRMQHFLLPMVVLVAFAVRAGCRRRPGDAFTAVAACLGLLLAFLFHGLNARTQPMTLIALANATDTYLAAVVPNASDVEQAMHVLGLPDHCRDAVGMNWYSKEMRPDHLCPEVADVSRARIIHLSVVDPKFFVAVTSRGIAKLRPWIHPGLGQVGGRERARITEERFTIATWPNFLSERILILLFLLPLVVFAAGVMPIVRRTFDDGAAVCVALAAASYLVFYSSLFGDGFFEFVKHAHLYFSILAALAIVAVLAGIGAIANVSTPGTIKKFS
jgi:hypothetical protein